MKKRVIKKYYSMSFYFTSMGRRTYAIYTPKNYRIAQVYNVSAAKLLLRHLNREK